MVMSHGDVTATYRRTPWATTPGTYPGLDRFGRVTQQWWWDYEGNGADVDKFTYGYDPPPWHATLRRAGKNSNRLWKENVVSGELETPKHLDEKYTYDDLNRLTAMDRGTLTGTTLGDKVRNEAWTLDDVGNWTTYKIDADGDRSYSTQDSDDLNHDRDHNKANEIEDDPDAGTDAIETAFGTHWDDPAHDAQGNPPAPRLRRAGMTQAPVPGDETHHHVCTYDAWNRLVKVQTDAEPAVTVAEYRYDPPSPRLRRAGPPAPRGLRRAGGLHRRIAKLVYDPQQSDWDRTDYYYTLSWQVIEERLATNVATAHKDDVATEPTYQYVWSLRYIDACILRDENTDPGSDDDCTDDGGSERIYYANGANMEVTALLEADGDVTERYIYDPYGKVTIYDDDCSDTRAWSASKKNELLYCGYRYDPETRLYHVRHRMYHPTLGRWGQRDSRDNSDGMNMQRYASSCPTTRVDPLGQDDGPSADPQTVAKLIQQAKYASPISVAYKAQEELEKLGGTRVSDDADAAKLIQNTKWTGTIVVSLLDAASPEGASTIATEWRMDTDLGIPYRYYPGGDGSGQGGVSESELPEHRPDDGKDPWDARVKECPRSGLLGELVEQKHFYDPDYWISPTIVLGVKEAIGVDVAEEAVYVVGNHVYHRTRGSGFREWKEARLHIAVSGLRCKYRTPNWLKDLVTWKTYSMNIIWYYKVVWESRHVFERRLFVTVRWGRRPP
jgi:RHS repeat-associated protein